MRKISEASRARKPTLQQFTAEVLRLREHVEDLEDLNDLKTEDFRWRKTRKLASCYQYQKYDERHNVHQLSGGQANQERWPR